MSGYTEESNYVNENDFNNAFATKTHAFLSGDLFDPIAHLTQYNADTLMDDRFSPSLQDMFLNFGLAENESEQDEPLDTDVFLNEVDDEYPFEQPSELVFTLQYPTSRPTYTDHSVAAPYVSAEPNDSIELDITADELHNLSLNVYKQPAKKTTRKSGKISKQRKTTKKAVVTEAELWLLKEKKEKKKNKRLCDVKKIQMLNACNVHKRKFMGANKGIYSGKELRDAVKQDWNRISTFDQATHDEYTTIAQDFNTFAQAAYNRDILDESTKYMLNSKWRDNIKKAFWARRE